MSRGLDSMEKFARDKTLDSYQRTQEKKLGKVQKRHELICRAGKRTKVFRYNKTTVQYLVPFCLTLTLISH